MCFRVPEFYKLIIAIEQQNILWTHHLLLKVASLGRLDWLGKQGSGCKSAV